MSSGTAAELSQLIQSGVDQAVGALRRAAAEGLDVGELTDVLGVAMTQRNRFDAAVTATIGALDRTAAKADHEPTMALSTGEWLSHTLHISSSAAHAQVHPRPPPQPQPRPRPGPARPPPPLPPRRLRRLRARRALRPARRRHRPRRRARPARRRRRHRRRDADAPGSAPPRPPRPAPLRPEPAPPDGSPRDGGRGGPAPPAPLRAPP